MEKEILICDWDHESDDVRRVPRGTQGAADWMCHEHYLEAAKETDLPPWITLMSQGQEPELILAGEVAEALLELSKIKQSWAADLIFGMTPISGEPRMAVRPEFMEALMTTSADLEWIAHGENAHAHLEIFDIVVVTIIHDLEMAQEWGCPQEVLDEFDNANS